MLDATLSDRNRTRLFMTAVLILLGSRLLPAEELKAVLEAPIIDPRLPLQEVQVFTESRVPRLPHFESVEKWTDYANSLREQTLRDVVFRGEAAVWRSSRGKAEWLGVIKKSGYRIRKLRFEAVPGMWVPALLYEPTVLKGRMPVILNVNGHDRGDGKAADYKQTRCINQALRGMLALNVEWLGMGQLNTPGFGHYRMNQMDLCGTSGLAPFYLSMSRGLDILLDHPHADPERVAVAGLSGGGWQTIFISALDTRVTLSNPVAGYSSFRTRARFLSDLGDSEQTPSDLATVVDYTHLTAMRAPRPTLLTNNASDQCCFKAGHALPPLVDAAQPIFTMFGQSRSLRTHVNHDPGNHNFGLDNRQQLYRMLGDFFFHEDDDFDASEIDCSDQLMTRAQLAVELPPDNLDFHSLSIRLADALPPDRNRNQPLERHRTRLRKAVSAHDWPVRGIIERTRTDDALNRVAITWWLRIDGQWTVPGVEVRPLRGEPTETVIVVADAGRASVADIVATLVGKQKRVLAIDPFYFGESRIAERDFLFGLLVAAVGERPLGIQASQIAGIARWAERTWMVPVDLESYGPRTSLAATVAAAVETSAIRKLTVHGAMRTLREIIDADQSVNNAPELFCFGLLRDCDIPRMESLVGMARFERKDPADQKASR